MLNLLKFKTKYPTYVSYVNSVTKKMNTNKMITYFIVLSSYENWSGLIYCNKTNLDLVMNNNFGIAELL
jgi:hypothetical protein